MEKCALVDSINNLYSDINCACNNEKKNTSIFNRIWDELSVLFKLCFKKERKAELIKYRTRLKEYNSLIESQIKLIDNLLEQKQNEKIPDLLWKLKEKHMENMIKYITDEFYNIYETFDDKKVTEVYIDACKHKIIDQFQQQLSNMCDCSKASASDNKSIELLDFTSDWKKIFYLSIYIKNEEAFSKELFSDIRYEKEEYEKEEYEKEEYEKEEYEKEEYEKYLTYNIVNFQGEFGKAILSQRKNLEMTQQELSIRSGVGRTMIAKLERLQCQTTLNTAIKLLTALNLGIVIYRKK